MGDGYDPTVTGSQSHGTVTSNATDAAQSRQSTSAGASQVQSSEPPDFKTEDSDQASGSLEDQLNSNVQVDQLLRYSATIRTIVVDGVEYQVQSNDGEQKQEGETHENK